MLIFDVGELGATILEYSSLTYNAFCVEMLLLVDHILVISKGFDPDGVLEKNYFILLLYQLYSGAIALS